MTSAPVKNVDSLMNFVGGNAFTKTGGTTQTGSFGDVMNRTRSGGTNSQNKTVASKQSQKTLASDVMNGQKESVRPQKTVEKKADPVSTQKTDQMTEKQSQTLEKAGEEIVKEIAEEFDVSEEDVEKAMEILGLSVYSLFDAANLTQLVLQMEGGQDATVFLTDESLFTNLQNVIQAAADVKAVLAEEIGISLEELQALTEEAQGSFDAQPETGEEIFSTADNMVSGSKSMAQGNEAPQITVEVKSGDETVKLSTDEKGNVTGMTEVVSSETEKSVTEKHADEHEQKGNGGNRKESEDTLQTGGMQMGTLEQNKMQTAEVSFEQTQAAFSEQTREIMDQIMDYMKIQLKPGMEQLEMQLHPESLGTVHIQLSSKGGEVTAQFHVQNETVRAALESQIVSLQENLKDQGIKVEAVQVSVESHGFESNLWQGQGREENASSGSSKKTPRRINLNDLNGVVEEEASEEDILTAKMMEVNGNTVDYTV